MLIVGWQQEQSKTSLLFICALLRIFNVMLCQYNIYNSSDNKMQVNKSHENQQCFENDADLPNQFQSIELTVEITKKINAVIPANELRTARRPDEMAPRTFYLDRPFYLLPEALNLPTQEQPTQVSTLKTKQKLGNIPNLSLQQYFSQRQFRQVYNKLQTYKSYSKSFIGKLKGIDSLIDYNWKFYKQLQIQKNNVPYKKDSIDSDFQSGNVCRGYVNMQSQEKQYHLLIENDLNTYGYNNWFFFRVKNRQAGNRRFLIANFIKKTKFYEQGMLISIFSMKKYHYRNTSWFKGGNNITFQGSNISRFNHEGQSYNSLYFQYDFQYENDDVYFAMSQPYTYSRLVKFIRQIETSIQDIQVEVKNVCFSISNNIIPSLRFYKEDNKSSNVILILARQHPCQTVGSYIAEGIMKMFKSASTVRDHLFQQFEFIIIPMVNPDGVIHGMSRTNMSGLDLNRQWGQNSLKQLTPETIKIKQYILSIQKSKQIKYMIDLHGHGKKLNTFLFSCKDNNKQHYRQLSLYLNQLQQRFNIFNCTYGLTKDKQNTIRSQLKNIGVRQCYTLQTSLYGWKKESEMVHFNEGDYDLIAKRLLQSIFLIQGRQEVTQKYFGFTKDSIMLDYSTLLQKIEAVEQQNIQNKQILSDSDPEGDILDLKDLLGKCQNKILKKQIEECLNHNKNKMKKDKKMLIKEGHTKQKFSLSLKKEMSNKIIRTFSKAYDHDRDIRKSDTSNKNNNNQMNNNSNNQNNNSKIDSQKVVNNSRIVLKRQFRNNHIKSEGSQEQNQHKNTFSKTAQLSLNHNLRSQAVPVPQKPGSNRLRTITYKKVHDRVQKAIRTRLNRQKYAIRYTQVGDNRQQNHTQRLTTIKIDELSNNILEARYEKLVRTFNEAIPFLKIKKVQRQAQQHNRQIKNIMIAERKQNRLRRCTQENRAQQQNPSKYKQQLSSKMAMDNHKHSGKGNSVNKIIKLANNNNIYYHYPIF